MTQTTFLRVLILWFILTPCIHAQPSSSEFRVQVDRAQIRVNETLQLIISIPNPEQFSAPDLTPLEQDFIVSAPRPLRT